MSFKTFWHAGRAAAITPPPHLVAAWNGAGDLADLEPPIRGGGRRDVRRLADLLNQPVRAGLKPPKLTVWHTSIRLHPHGSGAL